MGKYADKCKQRYLDHPRDQFKLTSLIHGLGNSSDEWKVLSYFGDKYAKGRHFNEFIQEPKLHKRLKEIKK